MAKFTDVIDFKSALLRARSVGLTEADIRQVVDRAFGPAEVEPAPRRRSLTFSEWKAAGRPGAQPASGESVNLQAVDIHGRPVRDAEPIWSDYIKQEREARRMPRRNVIEMARSAGTPIKNLTDYRNAKALFGKGDDAA